MRSVLLWLVGLSLVALVAPLAPGWAQGVLGEGAPEVAEQRYQAGVEAYRAGNFTAAAREFRVALGFVPNSARLTYNLARCLERTEEVGEAITQYERYLVLAPEAEDRATVEMLLKTLRETLPEVRVTTVPVGAEVFVGASESAAGVAPLSLRLAPGEHVLRASAPGHRAAQRVVQVTSGTSVALTLEPEDAVAGASAGVGGEDGGGGKGRLEAGPTGEVASDWRRPAGWTGVGLGGAAVVAGAVFTALALQTAGEIEGLGPGETERHRELSDELSSRQTVMWVGYGVGVALAGAGVALLLWPQDGDGATAGGAAVSWGLGGLSVRF